MFLCRPRRLGGVSGAGAGACLLFAGVLVHLLGAPALACVGDCDGDGSVTVDEILKGVNIALGSAPMSGCPSFDRDGDGAVTIDELLAAVGAALSACPVEPVFPADYRASFTEVRDCRFSIEHDGLSIRVLANPIGTQPYRDAADPLPVGSIIVKEEFNGPSCDDRDLLRWSAMRKEAPGFDPADGDWRWQRVDRDRSVRLNDKATCIGCHARPACAARDHMCTVGGGPPRGTLKLVLTSVPAALLSIVGTAATDVYTVGADADDGFGPYVLHYDGDRWRRLNTHETGDLWWISVTPIDGNFYMAGGGGLILRYEPSNGTFDRERTPGAQLLFGIWGTSGHNLWAVGGDPSDEDQGGVLWRFDGISWGVEDLSNVLPNGTPTLFKVWGRAENDVYVVGRRGTILHFDGAQWSQVNSNTTRPLFTVHGNDTVVVVTGGFSDGVIQELAGDAFVARAAAGTPQMNGVFIPPDGRGVAVGIAGALALRADPTWEIPDTGLNTLRDFHATWVDPDGGIWAVGGDLSTDLTKGILAYGGTRTISSQIVPLSPCPPPAPNSSAAMTVSYSRDVVPLLERSGCRSLSCHGGPFPSSAFDLRRYETSFGPGVEAKSLKVCEVVPGSADASFILEKLGPSPRIGARMPQNRTPLADADIELIRTWILEGAQDDSPPAPTGTVTTTRAASATPTRTPSPPPPMTGTPLATLTPAAACDEPGVICTVAGTGLSLFDGDGKPALQTSLYYPLGVTFDALERALIIDWNNLRIRRIDADGTVETIMGKDFEDFPTDGALATDTPLHHASDIAFDTHGRLYVAGDHVPVVFRVDTDNRVFTVAGTTDSGYDGDGGPARQAKLTSPFGVLPTSDGGFYISDLDANVVRFVDAGGIIRSVAGTGTAGYSGDGGQGTAATLASPARMRLDAEGNLYFCEAKNHVIRRLARDGVITTFAGTGTRGYTGDNGPATLAQFDTPYDLRFAPNGDLYVADTGNDVIRRIDRTGTVTTVAGTGRPGFAGDQGDAQHCQLNGPSGITFAGNGSLWIADTFNQRVRRITQRR